MTSHSPSLRKWNYSPSGQAFIAVFVVLIILFLWLHLILAWQIESIGRQIQIKNEELEKTQREIDALKQQIATAGTQENLANRALELGYRPQTPLYLRMSGSFAQRTGDAGDGQTDLATTIPAGDQSLSPWATLAQRLDVSMEAETTP